MAPGGGALRLQAAYFLATGAAPFVSRRAFEAVTGRKHDWWLVQTVGALVAVIGCVLWSAERRGRADAEIVGLAAGSALALAAIDVVKVAERRVRPVYLVDAAIETTLAAGVLREHLARR